MLARRIKSLVRTNIRPFSIRPETEPVKYFRTEENNPLLHNESHAGQFYTIDKKTREVLFKKHGIPAFYLKQIHTFTETCLMVRGPAIELIDLIKRSDLSKPVNRFVLYGDIGTGKSLTMVHLLHYAYESGFLIVHIPWVPEWYNRLEIDKEMVNSTTREGLVDLPVDAVNWLLHFKAQNQNIFKNENLTTSQEYVWSKREVTPAGSHIKELVEFGINRIKYASDIIIILMNEIKLLSTKKSVKTFVAIDGYNSIYNNKTLIKTNTKRDVKPHDVTLTHAIFDIVKNDWCNGVVLLTIDPIATRYEKVDGYFPQYLLEKKGFENLDPFIPIECKNYTEKEFLSCMAYYRDRKWIRGHPEAETELSFSTGMNPFKVLEYSTPL